MSHQYTLSDSIDPFKDLKSESYELLLVDSRQKYSARSVQNTDLPRHAKLASTWKDIGKTSSAMAALFLLAWAIATIHLAVFIYLDRKPADGPNSIPQSYIATLSHLLGLTFRASLCGSLVLAFTQNLWRLMRVETMKVSSIELLFKITHNPFLLGAPEVVKIAPTLFLLAFFTWLLPIAITFPPGALIVVPYSVQSSHNVIVPRYNGSFLGNNSYADAELKSLASRYLSGGTWGYLGATPSVRRVGRLVLELDSIVPSSSPCGPDCTYDIQFEGPYLRCIDTMFNLTSLIGLNDDCYRTAFSASSVMAENSNFFIGGPFNMSASRSIDIVPKGNETIGGNNTQEFQSMSCTPSRAFYDVRITYIGGIRSITRSYKYLSSIRDMMVEVEQYSPVRPNCGNRAECFELSPQDPAEWNWPLLQTLTAFNHFALIDALITPLSGNYTMTYWGTFMSGASSPFTCGATNGSLVADTRLNTQRDNVSRSVTDGPNFVLSQDILNDALFNITMSAAYQIGFWQSTVPVNETDTFNTFSFASRRTLIIPYLICLLLSIPFLYLGINSLRLNGVSAMEGGFIQVLMTTNGSKALEKAAAGGCLGGGENVPEDLKNLKIRFGELVNNASGDTGVVRRAGFGTEDEVAPLKKSVTNGA